MIFLQSRKSLKVTAVIIIYTYTVVSIHILGSLCITEIITILHINVLDYFDTPSRYII